MALSLELIFIP